MIVAIMLLPKDKHSRIIIATKIIRSTNHKVWMLNLFFMFFNLFIRILLSLGMFFSFGMVLWLVGVLIDILNWYWSAKRGGDGIYELAGMVNWYWSGKGSGDGIYELAGMVNWYWSGKGSGDGIYELGGMVNWYWSAKRR